MSSRRQRRQRGRKAVGRMAAMKPETQSAPSYERPTGFRKERQQGPTPGFRKPPQEEEALRFNNSSEGEGFFSQVGSGAQGVVNRIDDSTQAFVRDHILRLPTDGSRLDQEAPLSGLRQALGKSVFKARSGYEGDNTAYRGTGSTNDNIGLGASRALQGGLITAAGYGLAELTTQFGSQADYQEPNQLSM